MGNYSLTGMKLPNFRSFSAKEVPHNHHDFEQKEEVMYRYLAGRLKQLGILQEDLGCALGLCGTAISHRMTGRTAWNVEEMYKVLEICRAQPEELHIYFPPKGGMSA